MLVYTTLNKFYEGTDYDKTSPLSSQFLNSIINQIENNFVGLDKRLDKIEAVFVDSNIDVKYAKIQNSDIDNSNILNANIDSALVNKGSITDANIQNLETQNGEITNFKSDRSIITNLLSENSVIQEANINSLTISKLSLSDKYLLDSNKILFYEDSDGIEIETAEDEKNGLKISGKSDYNRNSYLTLQNLNKAYLDIRLDSDNKDDYIEINTPSFVRINGNLRLNENIIFENENIELGIEGYSPAKIKAKQFYGSYFSYNADIAEIYEADKDYEEGTILEFGNETEATIAKGLKPVLGVVSKSYGYLLNNEADYKYSAPVALKGRIYCKLSKKGERGDFIIVDEYNPGYGYPTKKRPKDECIVGILLDPEKNIIKV